MQDPDELTGTIAANVRRLRQERGLTIDLLAERGGLSRGTVIQVEQGRANPNIATLGRLADALSIGVATLIAPEAAPRVVVRRQEETAALWSSPAGSRALFLVGTDPPEIVELWDWHVEPGDAFDGEAHPPGTIELLAVLDGELTLTVGERVERVAAGDSVLFDAVVAHRYANEATRATRFVMSVLQPAGGPLGPPGTISPADGAP